MSSTARRMGVYAFGDVSNLRMNDRISGARVATIAVLYVWGCSMTIAASAGDSLGCISPRKETCQIPPPLIPFNEGAEP